MKVLVTGGAGYIGSHMVERLLGNGIEVVIIDNLTYGHKEAVLTKAKLIVGDLGDIESITKLFDEHKFDAVFHFAAFISMAESVENPKVYFRNNVFCAQNLLDAMVQFNVKKLIFSSTAGVYGNPKSLPISEEHECNPTNPYGESKLMVEKILHWYDQAYGLKSVSLRYFNAAGASLNGSNGEDHDPETHIIPLAIKTALGGNSAFEIYGHDYPTKDGTCVRDYIHVIDLVEAHLLALEKLSQQEKSRIYNVGTGTSYTNKEVVEMVKKVSGVNFPVEMSTKRPGDAVELVASSEKIKKELGFVPKYSDLETIIKTAWDWHKSHPNGFNKFDILTRPKI
ncbi:UDP-glucose 4-epimerase GalE [Candidatus Gottesmanbacteria bacterium]|nr:UDP-glucose 4-epimerase GalE [Candidatus Gottesmanbacteria bacterium]